MNSQDQVAAVMAAYPPELQPEGIEELGSAGGYSGARFWRLITRQKLFCLRRWPVEHPSPERLHSIHAVLRRVAARGMVEVPAALLTRRGESFVRSGEHLWELTPWLPGAADYRAHPRPAKLAAALRTLARFHQLAAEPWRHPDLVRHRALSNGVTCWRNSARAAISNCGRRSARNRGPGWTNGRDGCWSSSPHLPRASTQS